MWLAWITMIVGTALLTTVKVNTHGGYMIAWLAITSVGLGILTSTTYFPVLAPRSCCSMILSVKMLTLHTVHVSQNALALAFFTFARNFAQVNLSLCVFRSPN
jgi:hypothetical protein